MKSTYALGSVPKTLELCVAAVSLTARFPLSTHHTAISRVQATSIYLETQLSRCNYYWTYAQSLFIKTWCGGVSDETQP
ncbi:MAG: hypothetical protein KME30_21975 [Iphinoe sp. HA4291-MV1]|nr:hypothetical protein [Iphinoe sp. HA4291-MV1]